jgi:hypothetical protein
MGTEAPRRWRQLLEQLQVTAAEAVAAAVDSDAAGNSWQPSNMQAIYETIWSLDRLQTNNNKPPKAAWKKLLASQVHALQVAAQNPGLCVSLLGCGAARSSMWHERQLTHRSTRS